MPTDPRPTHFRTSFDQVAEEYDAERPGYPPALIDDIVALAALPSPARILEIGCGTGQATQPFAERGDRFQTVKVDYRGGLRWPWVERAAPGTAPTGLDRLLLPLRAAAPAKPAK